MKQIKKLVSLITIFILVLVTTSTVSASGAKEIVITNNPAQTGVSMEGHTYSAYKVFDVALTDAETAGYLYTVAPNFETFFKSMESYDSSQDLNEFAINYVNGKDIATVANELREYVVNSGAEVSAKATSEKVSKGVESATIPVGELGYYLVLDNGNGVDANAGTVVATAALGTTDNTLNITLKASGPTIDKEIYHNEHDSWGPVGDNQIGDKVEYRLIATVPNTTGYKNYTYQINDKMTSGLTFNNDIEIYVGNKTNGVKLSEAYYTIHSVSEHTFAINIKVMKGIADQVFEAQDQLYVYYSATLNENAVIANGSNDNTVDLEYSNNPYDETSKDKTPEITVKDYTFKLNVLKTKEDAKTALQGAEFEIHENDTALKFTSTTKEDGTVVYVVSNDENASATLVSPENGKFEIVGLDDATHYTIYETKAPAGYNAIDPIHFMIKADYDANGNISSVTVNSDKISVGDTFELGTTIVNTTGSKLPETGGVGTTMFTVIGLGLMVSAVALVAKKRQATKA